MNAEQELQDALAATSAAHFDGQGAARDYGALCTSAEHARVVSAVGGLADLNFKQLRIAAQTAFWLNVFNSIVVRDIAELAQAETVKEVEAFFEKPRVRVAGFGYSLDDIEHGLLRGNVPKFGAKRPPMQRDDPRLAHTPLAYDERMHFGLYTARRSSPPLRVFHPESFESQLEQATEHYLRATVQMKDEQFRVKLRLPQLFKLYGEDFGDERDVLEFVLARLDEEVAQLVDRRDGRVKFMYLEYDAAPNTRAR